MRPAFAYAALLFTTAFLVYPQTAERPSFEVASVKVLADMPFGTPNIHTPDRIRRSTTLMGLVLYAYHLQGFQVSGMPKGPISWYTIDAKTNPAATDDQIRLMFQTLLADRFKLTTHRETRELNGYALVVGKNGPRIEPAKDGDKPAPLPPWFLAKGDTMIPLIEGQIMATAEGNGINAVTGRRVTLTQLAELLEQEMGAFVLDKTGLTGKYYFGFKCLQMNSPLQASAADVPDVFTALQETLGVKLQKEKGPVEMMIVDHLETVPTAN